MRVIHIDELNKMLVAADRLGATYVCGGERGTDIIVFLVETGARLSEALNVIWDYIDWETRTVYIPTSKFGKERSIPMPNAARAKRDATSGATSMPKPERPLL